MRRSTCPECGAEIPAGEQTCPECGEPVSYAPDEEGVRCRVCGAEIAAYTETCPGCGEGGYPALRPRKGGHFKGSPELEGGGDEEGEG